MQRIELSRTRRALRAIVASMRLAAVPSPGVSQHPLEADPGYLPVDELGLLRAEELSLEINLHGAMMSMISAFLGSDEPELAEVVSGLRGVSVRAAELSAERLREVRDAVAEATAWLDGRGWQPVVRVREPGEEVLIYTRGDGDRMDGLAILALDETEVTVVNLVGSIDLARLSVVIEGFDLPASAVAAGEGER